MMSIINRYSIFSVLLLSASVGAASAASHSKQEKILPKGKLVIDLNRGEETSREDVVYQCGGDLKKMTNETKDILKSLPKNGRVTASYFNANMISLVSLPIDGNTLVFSNVISGSGAKYVADRYSWWTEGDKVTFSRVGQDDVSVSCQAIPKNASNKSSK